MFDFSCTENISVSGAIVIKACFDKLCFDFSKRSIEIKVSESKDKIRQILQHIEMKNYGLKITYEDIARWSVRSYNMKISKKNLIREIEAPIQTLTNWKNEDDKIKHILEAVPEACWNSFEHGYKIKKDNQIGKDNEKKFTKAYLIFGKVEKNYSFCIFDRGIGFRGSFQFYHRKYLQDFLAQCINWGEASKERKIIEKAIEMGKESPRAEDLGRGSGLPAILESITQKLRGRVMIHSLRGYYQKGYKSDKQSKACEDIQGTLVQFEIPIC